MAMVVFYLLLVNFGFLPQFKCGYSSSNEADSQQQKKVNSMELTPKSQISSSSYKDTTNSKPNPNQS